MTQIVTTNFRNMLANKLVEDVNANDYYVFAGKTLEYDGGDGLSPPDPSNSDQQLEYILTNHMIFGKYVTDSDVSLMIKNKPWVANTVYYAYDDSDGSLDTRDFYVVSQEGEDYGVFKCINNYNSSPSTVQPLISETSASDEFYQTSDNYVWKFMYKISTATYAKFATTEYFPFLVDSDVVNNAVAGTIDYVEINESGFGYNQTASGIIVQTNIGGNTRKFYVQGDELLNPTADYYVNNAVYIDSGTGAGQLRKIIDYGIEGNFKFVLVDEAFTTTPVAGDTFIISPNVVVNGNGTGFRARAIVNEESTFIDRVEIIESGSGYLYANVSIETNETYVETGYTKATARAIVLPKNGHGSDPQKELFAKNVGFSINFAGDEAPSANNDFRVIGVLKNPLLNNITIDLNNVSGINVGDSVLQANSGASGKVLSIDSVNTKIELEETSGIFDPLETVVIANTSFDVANLENNNDVFDQTLNLGVTYTFQSAFDNDERVIESGTNAEGYVYSSENGTVNLINTKGSFSTGKTIIGQTTGTRALINSISQPDMILGSETILYVQNVNPIVRSPESIERIKIVIGF